MTIKILQLPIFIILTVMLTITTYSSQLGFKIGGNKSIIYQESKYRDIKTDYKYGWQLGASYLTNLYVISNNFCLDYGMDFIFTSRGSIWKKWDMKTEGGAYLFTLPEIKATLYYINVPFYLKLDILKSFYIATGPYVSLLVGGYGDYSNNIDQDVKSVVKDAENKTSYFPIDYGFTGRIGYDFNTQGYQIPIELIVDYGLFNFNTTDSDGPYPGLDAESNTFTISIQSGILFNWN